MASLYTRKRSPYWWVQFRDRAGKRRQVSTGFKTGNAPDARRAQALRAQKEIEELTFAPTGTPGAWMSWVEQFLAVRYGAANTRTHERYLESWRPMFMFLEERDIRTPAQFNRQYCFDYIGWRSKPDLRNGRYKAGRNTAIHDLKIMRIIMNEAVERGYCQGNPCLGLRIERSKSKLTPELTDEQIETIRLAIARVKDPKKQEFLHHSFEIARYQGCRLSETYLNPMEDVNVAGQWIRFRVKGDRLHQTLLHPKLIPLFEKLQTDGRTTTYERPVRRHSWASSQWSKFLSRIGIAATFHSLRVTAATALARNKVPENMAKQFIGHASTTVHRGYLRFKAGDLGDCAKAIG